MGRVDLFRVEQDYLKLKSFTRFFYKAGLYKEALGFIEVAANFMYNFNVLYFDNEFELIIKDVASKYAEKLSTSLPVGASISDKRIIFYDYFSIDNRGLTEQYLRGLLDLGYEVLYVSCQKDKSRMRNILALLSEYHSATILFVSSSFTENNFLSIISEIKRFGSSQILVHSSPWDVLGCLILSFLSDMTRFLINITDHAYWLGNSVVDYVIEFRSYGYNVSRLFRNINPSKCLYLPYYPVRSLHDDFNGFPFDSVNKKVIFSGGALYKISGSQIFLDIVKYILESDKSTIFFYVGNGDASVLKQFIERNKYEDRFFYSEERRDINELFKHCYFYLGTYPIPGGLMSQYAVSNNKVVLSLYDEALPINNTKEFFIDASVKMAYTNIDELKMEISRILHDESYLRQKEQKLKNMVISTELFTETLGGILTSARSSFSFDSYNIDAVAVQEIYFEQENKVMNRYDRYFVFGRHKLVMFMFPIRTIRSLIYFIKKRYFHG